MNTPRPVPPPNVGSTVSPQLKVPLASDLQALGIKPGAQTSSFLKAFLEVAKETELARVPAPTVPGGTSLPRPDIS